ncbi:gamma-glutamylcyclotransferase [soil metagenome]
MSPFNLFVYGTLQRGGSAHDQLRECDCAGAATVGGTLYDIDGRFPALLLYGDAPVRGEVWRCPAALLPQLDAYEGRADSLFRRVGVEATASTGDRLPCWVYTAGPALSRKLRPEARLPHGAWPVARGSG